MSYQNPVPGVPDPSEIKKQHGGEPFSYEEPKEKEAMLAHLLHTIQKRLDKVLERLGGEPTVAFTSQKTLKALKETLEALKVEDRSQDADFLNLMAQYWNEALYGEHPKEIYPLFRIFVRNILTYPENQSHTFGYYLSEQAGQKWIPFPYMELIQKIHHDHETNPSGSALTEWIRLLNDMINHLQD